MALDGIRPGWFVKFRGSWGEVELVNDDFVFLNYWRDQPTTTAPIREIQEVKTDQRTHRDAERSLGRRLTDFEPPPPAA
jgi:hypothetical protein